MSYPCPVPSCGRRATEWAICRSCATQLERDLHALPALVVRVTDTLARRGAGTGRSGSPSTSPPLPYDTRASAVLGTVKATLVGWVRVLLEDTDQRWPADTSSACAIWLVARIAVLRVHPAAVEIAGEIAGLVASCHRVTDNPAERFYVGLCDECGRAMYAKEKAGTVWCANVGCRRTYDVAERKATLLIKAKDEWLTIPELLRVLPQWGAELNPSTVRSWRRRGQLVACGVTFEGRSLYRVGDVTNLLEDGDAA